MKRLFALMLSIIMLLSISVPVYAREPRKVTVAFPNLADNRLYVVNGRRKSWRHDVRIF